MNRSAYYIDQLRKLTPTGSDYAVAKLIGVSENAVNHYRKGTRAMSVRVCILVAEKLRLPPLQVIADIEAERANDPDETREWKRYRRGLLRSPRAHFLTS